MAGCEISKMSQTKSSEKKHQHDLIVVQTEKPLRLLQMNRDNKGMRKLTGFGWKSWQVETEKFAG